MTPPPAFANALFLVIAMSLAGLVHVFWLKSRWSKYFRQPLDGRFMLRGRRILGENKMVRGFIAMPLATMGVFAFFGAVRDQLPAWFASGIWSMPLNRFALFGLACGFGFMFAELPNSFLKRQMDISPGEAPAKGWLRPICFILDRCDSVLGVLIVVSAISPISPLTWFWALILGPLFHAFFSIWLYLSGEKRRPL